MIRLSRVVIVAGAAVTFAACSEMGPTAPDPAPAVAGDIVIASAPVASASCTVTQTGTGYDVTVTWSGLAVTSIELWQSGGVQPLAQTVLGHPTRSGTEIYTLTSAPTYAQISGHPNGLRAACVSST